MHRPPPSDDTARRRQTFALVSAGCPTRLTVPPDPGEGAGHDPPADYGHRTALEVLADDDPTEADPSPLAATPSPDGAEDLWRGVFRRLQTLCREVAALEADTVGPRPEMLDHAIGSLHVALSAARNHAGTILAIRSASRRGVKAGDL